MPGIPLAFRSVTVDEIINDPNLLEGMNPQDLINALGGVPSGFKVEAGQGVSVGRGWKLLGRATYQSGGARAVNVLAIRMIRIGTGQAVQTVSPPRSVPEAGTTARRNTQARPRSSHCRQNLQLCAFQVGSRARAAGRGCPPRVTS
jgi:hypothetical protein